MHIRGKKKPHANLEVEKFRDKSQKVGRHRGARKILKFDHCPTSKIYESCALE